MADWDANSQQLTQNIIDLMESSVWEGASQRKFPSALKWHNQLMTNLNVPNPKWVGTYRGADGLESIEVRVDDQMGTPANEVRAEISQFENILKQALTNLDKQLPSLSLNQSTFTHTSDQLFEIIELCAWAHAEWVRIHPFANGNGRIARIWANYIALRYGLPAFVQIRPRPDPLPYGAVGRQAMQGDWKPTIILFQRMLNEYLSDPE